MENYEMEDFSPVTRYSVSTTTIDPLPIICLIEWNSKKCREQMFQIPMPKFAQSTYHIRSPAKFIEGFVIDINVKILISIS